VEEAKLPHPNGPTKSEPNDPPLLATVEPEQSMKDLNAKEKKSSLPGCAGTTFPGYELLNS
jgi:hypothetical protein